MGAAITIDAAARVIAVVVAVLAAVQKFTEDITQQQHGRRTHLIIAIHVVRVHLEIVPVGLEDTCDGAHRRTRRYVREEHLAVVVYRSVEQAAKHGTYDDILDSTK